MWLGISEKKYIGLRLPCMEILLLLQENKIRFHKSENCSKTQLKIFETIKYVPFGCVFVFPDLRKET